MSAATCAFASTICPAHWHILLLTIPLSPRATSSLHYGCGPSRSCCPIFSHSNSTLFYPSSPKNHQLYFLVTFKMWINVCRWDSYETHLSNLHLNIGAWQSTGAQAFPSAVLQLVRKAPADCSQALRKAATSPVGLAAAASMMAKVNQVNSSTKPSCPSPPEPCHLYIWFQISAFRFTRNLQTQIHRH